MQNNNDSRNKKTQFFQDRLIKSLDAAINYVNRSNVIKFKTVNSLRKSQAAALAANKSSMDAAGAYRLTKQSQLMSECLAVLEENGLPPTHFVTVVGFPTFKTRQAAFEYIKTMKHMVAIRQTGIVCIEIRKNKGDTNPYEPHLHMLLNIPNSRAKHSLKLQLQTLIPPTKRGVVFKALATADDAQNVASYLLKYTQTYSKGKRQAIKPTELLLELTIIREMGLQIDDLFFTTGDLHWSRQTQKFEISCPKNVKHRHQTSIKQALKQVRFLNLTQHNSKPTCGPNLESKPLTKWSTYSVYNGVEVT